METNSQLEGCALRGWDFDTRSGENGRLVVLVAPLHLPVSTETPAAFARIHCDSAGD